MTNKEFMVLILAIFEFGSKIFEGYNNAKEKHKEKQYVAAVRRGDVDAANKYLHS